MSEIKIPRFVREYANYRININNRLIEKFGDREEYPLFPKEGITEESNSIRKIVRGCERGFITINEAMKEITNIPTGIPEGRGDTVD